MALKDQDWLRRHQHTLVYLGGGGGGACLALILCFVFPFLAFYFFFTNFCISIILIVLYLLSTYFLLYILNIIFILKETIEDNSIPDNEIPKYTEIEKTIYPFISNPNFLSDITISIINYAISTNDILKKNKDCLLGYLMYISKETVEYEWNISNTKIKGSIYLVKIFRDDQLVKRIIFYTKISNKNKESQNRIRELYEDSKDIEQIFLYKIILKLFKAFKELNYYKFVFSFIIFNIVTIIIPIILSIISIIISK